MYIYISRRILTFQQNDFRDLLYSLKKAVFSSNSSLSRLSSEQVRTTLILLLQLNNVINSASGKHSSSEHSYWRTHRLLQAIIARPDLVTLPSLRNLAELNLLLFENLEKGKQSIPPAPLSFSLDKISLANAEITGILEPTETAIETLIYNYISDSLQAPPGKFNQDPLNRLLGYTFSDRLGKLPYSTSTHSPHIQRAREIMGPAISETMILCRGFWCPLLSAEDFFALVEAHQANGGVRSEGFRKLLRKIEGRIEEGLRAGIKRTSEGFPYRFGVDAPGLEKVIDPSHEDQLSTLEAQGRLRYLQVHREKREEEMGRRSEERIRGKSMNEKMKAALTERRANEQGLGE